MLIEYQDQSFLKDTYLRGVESIKSQLKDLVATVSEDMPDRAMQNDTRLRKAHLKQDLEQWPPMMANNVAAKVGTRFSNPDTEGLLSACTESFTERTASDFARSFQTQPLLHILHLVNPTINMMETLAPLRLSLSILRYFVF